MRILVVGGSGLIGAHVAEVLRERGHAVTAVARTAQPGLDHLLDLQVATVEQVRPLPKPIYPAFRGDLVEPVARLFTAARLEGLTRGC